MTRRENSRSNNAALRLLGWSPVSWALYKSKARIITIILFMIFLGCVICIIYIVSLGNVNKHKYLLTALSTASALSVIIYFRGVNKHVSFKKTKNVFTGVHAIDRLTTQLNNSAKTTNEHVYDSLENEGPRLISSNAVEYV